MSRRSVRGTGDLYLQVAKRQVLKVKKEKETHKEFEKREHTREEEVAFRQNFLNSAGSLQDAVYDGDFLRSAKGTFLTKLIIYKDKHQQALDSEVKIIPFGTATTPTSAVKLLRSEMKFGLPIALFVGEAAGIDPWGEQHCWAVIVKEGKLLVKESVPSSSTGKVPGLAKKIAQELKIPRITLLEPSSFENASDEQCVEITYWNIGEILDGVDMEQKYDCLKIYDVSQKTYMRKVKGLWVKV